MNSPSTDEQDLEVLDGTLNRIVVVADSDLTPVLARVVPRLLPLLDRSEPVREKCIQIFAHIRTRLVKGAVELPIAELVQLYQRGNGIGAAASVTAIKLIDQAFVLATPKECLSLLDALLRGVSARPYGHRQSLVNIVLRCLPLITYSGPLDQATSKFPFLSEPSDRSWMFALFQDFLLLRPQTQAFAKGSRPDCGFSQASWDAMEKVGRSIAELAIIKSSILKFLSSGSFLPCEVFIHGVIAMSDSNHEVISQGEILFRRIGKPDINDLSVANSLLSLYIGSPTRTCASYPLKLHLLPVFCQLSHATATVFKAVTKVVYDSAFGTHSITKLTIYGMELLAVLIRHGGQSGLKVMGPLIFGSLTKLYSTVALYDLPLIRLIADKYMSNMDACKIRSLIYDSISHLISAVPEIGVSSSNYAKLLFQQLRTEVPSVRVGMKTPLQLLATVFSEHASSGVKLELKSFLIELCQAPPDDVLDIQKECALIWISRVYSFNDCEVDDESTIVRDAAKRSLLPHKTDLPKVSPFPRFIDFMELLKSHAYLEEESAGVLKHALIFLRMCIAFQASEEHKNVSEVLSQIASYHQEYAVAFASMVYIAFERFTSKSSEVSSLQYEASVTMLLIVSSSPQVILSDLREKRLEWVRSIMCNSTEESTRKNMSEIWGFMFSGGDIPREVIITVIDNLYVAITAPVKDQGISILHGSCLGLGQIVKAYLLSESISNDLLINPTSAIISLLQSPVPLVCSGACTAICTIAGSRPLPLVSGQEVESMSMLIERLKLLGKSCQAEHRVSEIAISALGHIATSADENTCKLVIDALISLNSVREEQVLFSVGEALVLCCNGTLASITSSSPAVSRPFRSSILSLLIKRLTEDLIYNGSVVARCAGSVWLLCLVRYVQGDEIASFSNRIQEALASQLLESRVLTLECACKGLAIIFQNSPASVKEELIRALMILAPTSKKDNSESCVKELFGIARELGKPELIYKFLDISCQHSIWSTEHGAGFSLGSLAQVSAAIMPNFTSIVSKLYRYQFDPILKIRSTMKALWAIDPAIVTAHFDVILSDLTTCMVDREPRIRQSSCTAILELISSRGFSKMSKHIERLYTNVLLVIDDVDDAVRSSGLSLSVALSSFFERVCDINFSLPDETSSCLSIILPVLIKNGIEANSKMVNSVAISTVARLVSASGKSISRYITLLLRILLEALSSFESQVVNYAMFHTATLNVTQEQLETVRLSMAKSSPLSSALTMCAEQVDAEIFGDVVNILTDVIHQGIGLPTMDGAAEFTNIITHRLPSEMALHSHKLVDAILPVIVISGPSVKRSLSTTLSHLTNVALSKQIHKVIECCKKLFFAGDFELSSTICRNLTQHVTSLNLRPYYSLLMPLCFLGKHCEDASASNYYCQAWEEGTVGTHTGVRAHVAEISELIAESIQSPSYQHKHIGLTTVSEFVDIIQNESPDNVEVLLPSIFACIACPYWNGKDSALTALLSVAKRCTPTLLSPERLDKMTQMLHKECHRSDNPVGCQALLFSTLAEFSSLFPDRDFVSGIKPVVENMFLSMGERSDSFNRPSDESYKQNQLRNILVASVLSLVSRISSAHAGISFKEAISMILSCLKGQDASIQTIAYTSLNVLLKCNLRLNTRLERDQLDRIVEFCISSSQGSDRESLRAAALDVLSSLIELTDVADYIPTIVGLIDNISKSNQTDVLERVYIIRRLIQKNSTPSKAALITQN